MVSGGRIGGSPVCHAKMIEATGKAGGSQAKEGRTPVARQTEKPQEDCGQQPCSQGSPGSGWGVGFFTPIVSPQGISPIAISAAADSACCLASRNGQLPPGIRNAAKSSRSTD